jgi:hypothetical protein
MSSFHRDSTQAAFEAYRRALVQVCVLGRQLQTRENYTIRDEAYAQLAVTKRAFHLALESEILEDL